MTESDLTRRRFLGRASVLGAVGLGAPALLSGCGSSSSSSSSATGSASATGTGSATSPVLSKAKSNGYISIGIAGEIPYGYEDKTTGKVTGEAPEVARAIFKNLGVPELRATVVDFSALIPGLNAGHFDMVCAGMDILPARCKQAEFSIPDYQALVAFLVPAGNPKGVKTFADVKSTGVTMAAEKGAVEITYGTSAGVPASQFKQFASPSDMLTAVTTGRVYGMMLTDISLNSLAKQNPSAKVEVTPGFKPMVNGKPQAEVGGFTFRKNETALVNAFNTQLKTLHTSGQWLTIVKPFGFTSENLPPANLTTAQLCAGS